MAEAEDRSLSNWIRTKVNKSLRKITTLQNRSLYQKSPPKLKKAIRLHHRVPHTENHSKYPLVWPRAWPTTREKPKAGPQRALVRCLSRPEIDFEAITANLRV